VIEIPSTLDVNSLVSCFEHLNSLFYSTKEIIISTSTINFYSFLADSLDNRFLMKKCRKVIQNQTQIFKLSSKQFLCYPKSWLNHLIDFRLLIYGIPIGINYSLFSCVCDKLHQLNLQKKEYSLSISNECLNCFISFFDLLKGFSFISEHFDFSSLKLLIECFGIHNLSQFLSTKIPLPQTFQESLQFLSSSSCEFLKDHYSQSISLIIQHFNLISFEDLNKLSNPHLLKIFSSDSLQLECEDYLFQIIIHMIKEDKNRMILLKTIHFEFVSSELMKTFFDHIHFDEIDIELFESLKKRLFSDYSVLNVLTTRWKSKPSILSQKETADLFALLNSHSNEVNSPIQQVKQMKLDNENLQNRILQLEKEISELKNPILKGKSFSYQNNHNGIIQELKQNESNSISLRCSSVLSSSYHSNNLLIFNEKYWVSEDESNPWICFKFNTKKIILSGYLFRSLHDNSYFNPKSWKLEASNDNSNWILIDNQVNRDWVTREWIEVYFPVETKNGYSYFKFTQTGKTYQGQIRFVLNFVEFFGTIILQ
jgi:hypothetical protein